MVRLGARPTDRLRCIRIFRCFQGGLQGRDVGRAVATASWKLWGWTFPVQHFDGLPKRYLPKQAVASKVIFLPRLPSASAVFWALQDSRCGWAVVFALVSASVLLPVLIACLVRPLAWLLMFPV